MKQVTAKTQFRRTTRAIILKMSCMKDHDKLNAEAHENLNDRNQLILER